MTKTPIGSQPIAQVHEAFLKVKHVVLKVQRRSIGGTMEKRCCHDAAYTSFLCRLCLKGLVDFRASDSEFFWSAAKEKMDFLQ